MQTEMFMKVNGQIILLMVKESILIVMEQLMKVIGFKTCKKGMVKRPGLMGQLMWVNTFKVKNMEEGSSNELMVHIIRVCFLKIIYMALDNTFGLMEENIKDIG